MPGLAGLAFELVGKMVDEAIKYREDSELDTCKRTLRRYKEAYQNLREEYLEAKKHSDQIIACKDDAISQLRSQAIKLTESNNDLLQRLSLAYIRETTGGVASMEEYNAAMAEENDDK